MPATILSAVIAFAANATALIVGSLPLYGRMTGEAPLLLVLFGALGATTTVANKTLSS